MASYKSLLTCIISLSKILPLTSALDGLGSPFFGPQFLLLGKYFSNPSMQEDKMPLAEKSRYDPALSTSMSEYMWFSHLWPVLSIIFYRCPRPERARIFCLGWFLQHPEPSKPNTMRWSIYIITTAEQKTAVKMKRYSMNIWVPQIATLKILCFKAFPWFTERRPWRWQCSLLLKELSKVLLRVLPVKLKCLKYLFSVRVLLKIVISTIFNRYYENKQWNANKVLNCFYIYNNVYTNYWNIRQATPSHQQQTVVFEAVFARFDGITDLMWRTVT